MNKIGQKPGCRHTWPVGIMRLIMGLPFRRRASLALALAILCSGCASRTEAPFSPVSVAVQPISQMQEFLDRSIQGFYFRLVEVSESPLFGGPRIWDPSEFNPILIHWFRAGLPVRLANAALFQNDERHGRALSAHDRKYLVVGLGGPCRTVSSRPAWILRDRTNKDFSSAPLPATNPVCNRQGWFMN
jgi:hypothetical protein